MSATNKAAVMEKVQASRVPVRQVLRQLGVPKSTYYRWHTGTTPGSSRRVPWNRLTEGERQRVLTIARASPAWSSRQVARWITDNDDFSVSESTVFRILKREGLVRRIEVPVPADNEYRHKTTAPQMGDRRFLLPRGGMGLLLHGYSAGRLLQVHPGVAAAGRHDHAIADRGSPGCHRLDGND